VRSPQPPRAVVLIRLLVGLVFFEEGIQKFLSPPSWAPAALLESASRRPR